MPIKKTTWLEVVSFRAFNGVEPMKHSLNILILFCVAGVVLLGSVALQNQGFVRLKFPDGELLIDGTKLGDYSQPTGTQVYP